jgi:hypothetical protein
VLRSKAMSRASCTRLPVMGIVSTYWDLEFGASIASNCACSLLSKVEKPKC